MPANNDLPAELVDIKPPLHMRIGKIASYVLYAWVAIGLVSLGTRMFLLLFSANPNTPFVNFVYRVSSDYLEPFRGIFPPRTVGETGYLDVAALFAIFMYLIVAWLVSVLIAYVETKIARYSEEERKRIAYEQRQQQRAYTPPSKVHSPTSSRRIK